MRILRFFILKIFLKRPLLVLGMITLLLLANYLSFTTVRSVISTFQGYEEMEKLNQEGTIIANLDPDSEADFNRIKIEDTQKVYEYLNNNYTYALRVDGFVTLLPNEHQMEVPFNYIDEEAYKINQLELSQGDHLNFNYKFNKDDIPVLIGAGLAKTYPVGSNIEITDPVTQQLVNLKVQGVLKKNAQSSNFYAPNSKNYHNFSIFLPINEEFIQNAGLDLHVNGLMDLILLDSTKEEAMNLRENIKENLGLEFNFFNQQENFEFFEDYYLNSLIIICTITLILTIIIVGLAIWNNLVSVRLMIRDFTINLLVGLSYSKLRAIFYSYFGMLFSIILVIVSVITAYNRYSSWLRNDSTFATYGILGLISMDWMALLIVLFIDVIIAFVIVELTIKKIKSIPISVGVLQ
ncbi:MULTISPECIES: peptide ABC transporter permease [Cytobacillus]|uniref:peptide ABC transporter permease n=1 Tax=Cytobacillus TaxID=2675230 RepID=UPI001CD3704D|nr:peptide ABC transporter permease [Cytobacillus kochii]MCA1027960.1 peptide ABC transporter permease [Cytobacillus kochii]MCM3323871.1 peptide ABC transporter permease [Cytobacillus kochii]MCM3346268.1 peptide ABC transporter permease [Cytobacillus kochii]MDM5205874.1 peptide ABC transporter permease [Cytobacillus kochii]